MKRVTVSVGHVTVNFQGEEIDIAIRDDGSLAVSKWQNGIERGTTIFAKNSWNVVSISETVVEQNA